MPAVVELLDVSRRPAARSNVVRYSAGSTIDEDALELLFEQGMLGERPGG